MSFRVEYKRGSAGPAMFQRHVRFQVDISIITKQIENAKEHLYAITFTLLSGWFGRFYQLGVLMEWFDSQEISGGSEGYANIFKLKCAPEGHRPVREHKESLLPSWVKVRVVDRILASCIWVLDR